jgi:hypothetical protein
VTAALAPSSANFQAGLNRAQGAANNLKNQYGADSTEYQSAQRAIDAYGAEGVNNGVVIAQARTGAYAATTAVAGNTVAPTADNPNGQNIRVTFNSRTDFLGGANLDNLALLAAHEGSHVANSSDWVSFGFSNNANPSRYQFEPDAYHVELNVATGFPYSTLSIDFTHANGNTTYPFSLASPQREMNATLNNMIRREYPNWNLDAFSRNTRLAQPH